MQTQLYNMVLPQTFTPGSVSASVPSFCSVSTPPSMLIPFHEAVSPSVISKYDTTTTIAVHFFIADRLFFPILHYPERYLSRLSHYSYIIMPDFSQYRDMPPYARFANNCLNRYFAFYLLEQGFCVIPNVTWSTPSSYSYAFSGFPTHSTIAINSNGARTDAYAMYLWQKGYNEALRQLEPSLILRYGPVMPDEDTAISVYYPNPYIERLRALPRKRRKQNNITDSLQTVLNFD